MRSRASQLARLERLEEALGEGPGKRLARRLFGAPGSWREEEFHELDARDQGWLRKEFCSLFVARYGELVCDLARYAALPEVQKLWGALVESQRRRLAECTCPPNEQEAARRAAMIMPFPIQAAELSDEERAARMQAACGMS